jgi:hypothetical protein
MPLHRGDLIGSASLHWVTVSGDRISGVADPSLLRGRRVVADVRPGAPLELALLEPEDSVTATEAEVGMALEPGDFPPDLAVGDQVAVVLIPTTSGASDAPVPTAMSAGARVRAVAESDATTGGKTVVTLVVPRADLELLASASRYRLARVVAAAGSA